MRKEIKQSTRESRVKHFIARIKFLANSKYYKNIKVSWAAYDSWAAQGQAGNCQICNVKHYNCSFQHKRRTTISGNKPEKYYWNEFGKICSACYYEIERQCNYKFTKF
jgi:hypothetical protein